MNSTKQVIAMLDEKGKRELRAYEREYFSIYHACHPRKEIKKKSIVITPDPALLRELIGAIHEAYPHDTRFGMRCPLEGVHN